MNILAIDTTTEILGVSIVKNGRVKVEYIAQGKNDHAVRLMPTVVRLMKDVRLKPEHLHGIVVASGPGSYTGTRVGITTAKSMAWALNIPLYSVSSLASLSYQGRQFRGLICPFIDARRETIYTALYRWDRHHLINSIADHHTSLKDWLNKLKQYKEPILFVSPHLDTYKQQIESVFNEEDEYIFKESSLIYPSSLVTLIDEQQSNHVVHHINPNYVRITEAEANVLKSKKGGLKRG